MLLALFIFGSSDIVENFLGRLSTVKAGTGGLELSLSPSAGTSTVNGQPELASEIVSDKTSTEGGHPVGNSDVPGLGFLSDISRMIDVDERYLKLYLGDRDDQIASNSGDDRELKDLAAQFIAPLAECQTELWRSTGTNPLSSRSYWVLLEPTHEFSKLVKYKASGSISDEVILKMATAYSVMASETIKDVFVIRKEIRDASTLSDPSKEGPDEYDTLSKKCETLSKIVCVGGKLYEPTNLSMDQPELFRRGGSLLCTHDSDDEITAVTSSEEHDDHLSVPNLIRQRVYRLLKQSYVKGEWDGRPYAALIAACISSILSQDEAAVEEIDDWLQDRSEQNWYDLRMRTVRAALTEYWMTSDLIVGSNASLEDFHIAQLGQIVWDLMKIPDYEASKDNYWHAAGKAPSLDVEEAYDGDQECRLPSKTKIKTDEDRRKEDLATLKYTQITYMMKYIDRAYKEHNFDQGNRVEYVEQMLKELNEVDLGCLSHYYPSVNSPELHEKIAWTRADIYRLNALWKSYEYKDTVRTLNPDDKRKRLSAALQAATAGLRVLEPEIKDETEHRTGRGLAEKIKPSEIRQEYVKLKLLADRVAQDVSALSPG